MRLCRHSARGIEVMASARFHDILRPDPEIVAKFAHSVAVSQEFIAREEAAGPDCPHTHLECWGGAEVRAWHDCDVSVH